MRWDLGHSGTGGTRWDGRDAGQTGARLAACGCTPARLAAGLRRDPWPRRQTPSAHAGAVTETPEAETIQRVTRTTGLEQRAAAYNHRHCQAAVQPNVDDSTEPVCGADKGSSDGDGGATAVTSP